MTNYEHYKNEIDKIIRMGRMVAVEENTGKVTSCNQITCLQCRFDSCKEYFLSREAAEAAIGGKSA